MFQVIGLNANINWQKAAYVMHNQQTMSHPSAQAKNCSPFFAHLQKMDISHIKILLNLPLVSLLKCLSRAHVNHSNGILSDAWMWRFFNNIWRAASIRRESSHSINSIKNQDRQQKDGNDAAFIQTV